VGAYIVRRVIWAIVVVLVVTLITFLVFFKLPTGNPALRFAGKNPTPELIAQIEENLGLDKPWPVQFGIYVKNLFGGDEYGWPGLGFSYDTKESIRDELVERLPKTLSLAAGAAIIWLVVGVAIGILSALKRRTIWDRLAMGFALFGISAPVFWLGLMSLWIFWEKLGILPGTGYTEFDESPKQWFLQLLQPWFVLALLFAANYARMTRGNLLDTLGEDYIRTARAKGLRERTVITHHGLRASLTPIVTMYGMDIAILIGGAVITETVFNIQGIGSWSIRSIFDQDFPVVAGVVVIGAVAVVVANLFVDLLYAYLDPRVRYG
jgi:peptide/nickel transport system permease protein